MLTLGLNTDCQLLKHRRGDLPNCRERGVPTVFPLQTWLGGFLSLSSRDVVPPPLAHPGPSQALFWEVFVWGMNSQCNIILPNNSIPINIPLDQHAQ